MLSWFDKKEGQSGAEPGPDAAPAGAGADERAADEAEWQSRLKAALGDDDALLALAQAAPVLAVRLAAVEALAGEAALKQAERAFRDHDRRVHSLAKRRHDQAVTRRESRQRAAALIDTALAMTTDEALPVNHLAALDRDWQAIDPVCLDVEQRARFSELRELLATQVRGRADHLQQVQRWNADARSAQAELRRALEHAAADGRSADLELPLAVVRQLLDARPDDPTTVAAAAALQSGAALTSAVAARLDWLDAAAQPPSPPAPRGAPHDVAATQPAGAADEVAQPTSPVSEDTPAPPPDAAAEAVAAATGVDAPPVPTDDDGLQTAGEPGDGTGSADQPGASVEAEPLAESVLAGETETQDQAALPVDAELPSEPVLAVETEPLAEGSLPVETEPLAEGSLPVEPEPPAEPSLAVEPEPPSESVLPVEPEPLAEPSRAVGPEPVAAPPDDADAQPAEPQAAATQATPDASPVSSSGWDELPAVADAGLSRLLAQRFEAWREAALRAAAAPARPARPAPSPEERAALAVKLRKLEARLQQADAALAEGHLDELQRHLQAIDSALAALVGVASAEHHRVHRQSLQAEFGRLRSWQKWGGGRARDDLVAEAENLARATAAADPDVAGSVKLNLKAHAETIAALRQRWKTLDRTSGAPNPVLWQRFDAALTLAHQPVAAQQAAMKAARQDNLKAREALLATLEAVPEIAADTPAEALAAQRKQQLAALEQFRTAWRKLGPPEHTVPAKARARLEQRTKEAVERIEAPLQEARRAAAAVREELVAQAQALVPEVERGLPMREVVARVRDLQARWQHEARSLPLARGVETALWSRFKAATDAVFAQREQAEKARDAEIAGHVAAAEALVARLESLSADTPAAEIRGTMADVDRAWREGTPLPRAVVQKIVARYEAARTAAQQHLAGSAFKRWRDQCDALAARLALCEQREAGGAVEDELRQRWDACGAVPAGLDKPLADRWAGPAGASGPLSSAALDDLLLQLEAAFGLPPAPEQEAARRQLKLLAMKQALEGRKAGESGPARHAAWFASVLRQCGASAQQRERLHALVAALRRGTPELLGLPAPRG